MAEQEEEGHMVSRGKVGGVGEVGVAPNVGGNTRKVKSVGAPHRED
ncbi:hypothetical protein MUK42_07123 [Musa troglodytarum]|uniref:Uncharacterized protein n=1 Tax=Musa troglodytarum TaxID=320322 RepID=A0A9E7H2Z3_9LILI|nr:hypothetical protein MUK42_07123 [Musa troglodytarum]